MNEARQGVEGRVLMGSWWRQVAALRSEVEQPGLSLEERVRVLGQLGEKLAQNPLNREEAIYILREATRMAEMMGCRSLQATNRLRLVVALENSGQSEVAQRELERIRATAYHYGLYNDPELTAYAEAAHLALS